MLKLLQASASAQHHALQLSSLKQSKIYTQHDLIVKQLSNIAAECGAQEYLQAFSYALHKLPSQKVNSAWLGCISKAATHVHCFMVAVQNMQCTTLGSSFFLQPLQKIQDLYFIISPVQLITNLYAQPAQPSP